MSGDKITIRQLARLSGVSPGTVSRALNGYTDVNPDTRERIERLARELDYTPAAAARSLKTRRSHIIGVFLDTGEGHPDLMHPFFHQVLVGVKSAIGAADFDLLLFASGRPGNGFGEHSLLKRCRHHSVEGVVIMGIDGDDPELRRLALSEVPCVGVDLDMPTPGARSIASDNQHGAELAVEHLYALGHRRIATITGLMERRPGRDRLQGYRRGLQANGLAYRDELVAYGDFYADSGREAAARLLALEEPPTAIVAASDMMALGAIGAAAEAGLRVPQDLSVVGFDDMQLAAHVTPPLTTLRQDMTGLGEAAGRALVELIENPIEGDPVAESTIVLPVDLIVRGSTAPPAGR